MTPEELAEFIHTTYERLAPEHGYETRPESAVPWPDVPTSNHSLMVAVAAEILDLFRTRGMLVLSPPTDYADIRRGIQRVQLRLGIPERDRLK